MLEKLIKKYNLVLPTLKAREKKASLVKIYGELNPKSNKCMPKNIKMSHLTDFDLLRTNYSHLTLAHITGLGFYQVCFLTDTSGNLNTKTLLNVTR